MRAAKERTHDRKRRHKATGAAKTDKSRTRRLANKAKRDAIHAIDPDMKIVVMNQRTYDKYGTEVEVIDGKINAVVDEPASFEDAVIEYQEIIEDEHPIIEKIETKNRSALQRLTDRFRKD